MFATDDLNLGFHHLLIYCLVAVIDQMEDIYETDVFIIDCAITCK